MKFLQSLRGRNILIVLLAAVAVVVGMNVLTTLVGSIIPLALTAVVAFVLGRLSASGSLLAFRRSVAEMRERAASVLEHSQALLENKPQREMAEGRDSKAEGRGSRVEGKATVKEAPAAGSGAGAAEETAPVKNTELLDPNFVVKTPEQIEAEVRLREQELVQKRTEYDPQAALEERRRRLLGNKDQG